MFEDRGDNEVRQRREGTNISAENRKYSTVGRRSVWRAEGGEELRTQASSLTHCQATGGNGDKKSRKNQVKEARGARRDCGPHPYLRLPVALLHLYPGVGVGLRGGVVGDGERPLAVRRLLGLRRLCHR